VRTDLNVAALRQQPVFDFTTDIDWAPEWAVRDLLAMFDREGVPLTPFLTHESPALRERYDAPGMRQRVGLHPNFLPGSSHGAAPEAVVQYVCGLWPEAVSFRAHSFFDNTHVAAAFAVRGFRYDSNLCLFLQPDCAPLQHASGMVRFPVYWEDDVHYSKGLPYELSVVRDELDRPGLKVINVHPIVLALNVPSAEFYAANKHLNKCADAEAGRQAAFAGKGAHSFVAELLQYVKRKGHRTAYLDDVFLEVTGQPEARQAAPPPAAVSEPVGARVSAYQSASGEQKAEIVRALYDSRDTGQIYATSPDFHLRELEIAFLARHIPAGARVVDLGCGNGYTLLSIAKRLNGDFLGIDFSSKMLEGARKLTARYGAELKSTPEFRQGDIRRPALADNSADVIITERCLQNLPTREDQYAAIREIHRILRPGGVYLMVEGTENGLGRLNHVRLQVGLPIIPSVSEDNVSALKFDEEEITTFLEGLFAVEHRQFFGTYYLISRVVHPLLVHPEKPRFDAKINAIARQVADLLPDVGNLGHVMGYKLTAVKSDKDNGNDKNRGRVKAWN
jgi:ubiquinone/menaquinone biosynthesis C-methylase UbiE